MERAGKKSARKSKCTYDLIPDYNHLFEQEQTTKGKVKTRFFRKIVKLNFFQILLSMIAYILMTLPSFAMPLCTSNVINVANRAVNNGGLTQDALIEIIINIAVLAFLIVLNIPMTILWWRVKSKLIRRTSAGIKSSVIRKLQSLSITYHKDMQSGKIQSKFLKDTDSVEMLLSLLVSSLIPNIISVIISTAISVYKNGYVALFFLFVIPFNVLLTVMFRKKIRRRARDFRVKTESMSMRLTTMLSMMAVTKAHGLEKKEIENVESSIGNLMGSGMEMDNTIAKFGSSSFVVNSLLSATCLIFCCVLAINNIIELGDIVLYQAMFSTISSHVSSLVGLLPQLGSGFEALSSVSEVMNAKDVEVNIGKVNVKCIKGNVKFDNVFYKYPNTNSYVIQNFSLDVMAGECVAVVGASGSGKSTIMNLIIGLLKAEKGGVYIDGKNMEDFNLSEYRHNISVVPQNSILFSGSIRENITYGLDNYTEEQLQKVVEMANLNEFVSELPNGLETNVGENGDKLSGGQKQRVTIARALIRNPRILILDEATSALDNVSEYHVQQAISHAIKGRTTFIVAHRLSTIRDADRIVVMENGFAVEMGTYQELMDKKGKFYELKALNEMNLKSASAGLE